MGLGDRVVKSYIYTSHGKHFVPVDIIESLKYKAYIEAELKQSSLSSELRTQLTDYVLNKPAINIFLTLVACNATADIAYFYKLGLSDDDLPLDHDIPNETPMISSRTLKCGKTVECDLLLPQQWGAQLRFDFFTKQWPFLAPIFTKQSFDYVLDKRCPVPFLDVNQSTKRGTGLSGAVREIRVHPAHQRVLKLVCFLELNNW